MRPLSSTYRRITSRPHESEKRKCSRGFRANRRKRQSSWLQDDYRRPLIAAQLGETQSFEEALTTSLLGSNALALTVGKADNLAQFRRLHVHRAIIIA